LNSELLPTNCGIPLSFDKKSASLVFPQPVRRNSHPTYYVISQAVTYGGYRRRLLALGVP